MRRVLTGVVVAGLLGGLPFAAAARTWTVERDGSGDYGVIQDAVDAAASGDTIRIGPGRFDEKQLVTCPGWSDSVRVLVLQHELTIIGSGPETIIGQEEPWEPEQGEQKGIVASDYWGNKVIRIEKLHMENMRDAIYTSYESDGTDFVQIQNCSFYANFGSIALIGDGGDVSVMDCSFNHMARDGRHIAAFRQSNLLISDCTLRLWDYHTWPQGHLGLENVQNALIEDCEMYEGDGAASVAYGGSVTFVNCIFDGQSNVTLHPSILSNVTVEGCSFRNQELAVMSITSDNHVSLNNCVIEDVADCSFYISFAGSISVHSSDIAHGERGAVWIADRGDCHTPATLDMTDNYWGTDDPDSIAAWIRDFNDSDQACYIVDFDPFSPESTPARTRTLSGVKDLFRR